MVEDLEKMSGYNKFIKDLVTKKITMSYKPIDNLHHYIGVTTRSLVQNKYNLGAFIILCTIGAFNFAKALGDISVVRLRSP